MYSWETKRVHLIHRTGQRLQGWFKKVSERKTRLWSRVGNIYLQIVHPLRCLSVSGSLCVCQCICMARSHLVYYFMFGDALGPGGRQKMCGQTDSNLVWKRRSSWRFCVGHIEAFGSVGNICVKARVMEGSRERYTAATTATHWEWGKLI